MPRSRYDRRPRSFLTCVVCMYRTHTLSAKSLTERKSKPSRWRHLLLFYKSMHGEKHSSRPQTCFCFDNNLNPTSIFKKHYLQGAASLRLFPRRIELLCPKLLHRKVLSFVSPKSGKLDLAPSPSEPCLLLPRSPRHRTDALASKKM